MLRFGANTLETLLGRWVDLVVRNAAAVVALSVALTIALGYYTATNLTINTDTDQMIDPELPFRQTYDDFNRLFPQLADSIIIVVDAETDEQADFAAQRLAALLALRDELVLNVLAHGMGPFFETNGLLFQDTEKLQDTSDRLADAAPILSALNEDPSLRGLSEVLVLALDDAIAKRDAPEQLAKVLADLTPIAEAAAKGRTKLLSWREMLADDNGDDDSLEDMRRDMRRRVIVAQPVLDYTSLPPAKASLIGVRAIADEVMAAVPGVNVRITGKMALGAEELKSVSEGAALSGIVSLILVSLVLGLGIRSLRLVTAALATLVMGLTWTAAFALAAIGYLNIISVAFAVLFIGLGIDFAIHFVLRYREEISGGKSADDALRRTALGVGGPLAVCAPTTALAFYAFVPTAYSGLAQLGIISGTGMFISLFTSLTLLPALLKLMPLKPAKSAKMEEIGKNRVGAMIDAHSRKFAKGGLVVGALALVSFPFATFQFDPIRLKDPTTESVTTFLDLAETGKSSPYAVQFIASDVDEAEALAESLKSRADVSRVITLSSFVPRNQDEKLEIIFDTSIFLTPVLLEAEPLPASGSAPDTEARWAAKTTLVDKLAEVATADVSAELRQAASALRDALEAASTGRMGDDSLILFEEGALGLFPATIKRLRQAMSATGVTLEDVPQDLRQRYQAADGRVRVEVFPDADLADQAALSAFVAELSATRSGATGSAVQVVGAGIVVIGAMKQATLTAAILIIMFLGVVLGRKRDICLIVAPVALAAAMTAAATVILVLPFNFANVIVLPLLIGLGVDSGIHLVMRAREADTSSSEARVLHTSTPRAVLLSALTTIGSFGSLALSAHRGTASMGLLLTVSVILTLVATLVVLPGLIDWVYGYGKRQNPTASK